MDGFKGTRISPELVRNLTVIGVTLLCAFAAWWANMTPFYHGDPAPVWGVASTVLFLAVWLAGMMLLQHRNPMLIPSLIFCSLAIWTLLCDLTRFLGVDVPYQIDIVVLFALAIYYGPISYLEMPYSSIAWYVIVCLQEVICIRLYLKRRRIRREAPSHPPESPL